MKLSIQKCSNYNPENLEMALERLIQPFGSFSGILKDRRKVLIKPNLLSAKSPEKAVTTHPSIVEWFVRGFQKIGASVYLGDSPPIGIGRIEEYWKKTGMSDVVEKTGAKFLYFEKETSRMHRIASGKLQTDISLLDMAFDKDVLILNLAKLKSHNLTVITGAVKNFFGLVPGLQKPKLHKIFPDSFDFGKLIAQIAQLFPNSFTVIDGITGMDGDGPAGGNPINTCVLLASEHPLAADLAFCKIIGTSPESLPIISESLKLNPHVTLEKIEISGNSLSEVKYSGFNLPKAPLFLKIPKPLFKLVQKLIKPKPRICQSKCIKCRACINICPAHAISLNDSSDTVKLNYSKCIACFCCTEVCPKNAIDIHIGSLLNLLKFLRALLRRY
ncbi:MAG: DUF362 domain-containing protein [Candidatus Riflebacteria bacterium]|nr:DUF362 domain-containing protein [Candidatus Riflebacteria bacterium]